MYPNPYLRPSIFSMLKNIGWSNLLDGTQKTLGVINQAIPIVYQVKPVVSNMRSVFKIANAIKAPDRPNNTNYNTNNNMNNNQSNLNRPVFYI